eukprot:jgi/Ulvmu1/3222/UM015_0263.1
MDAFNDVYRPATRAGSLRTQQEVRQSSQTRQQLTSLLSAVQASLAELKVEVASARQLSCDATPPSVTKISRSASPGCHGTLVRCLSPTIGSQMSPDSSSVRTRDVDLLQVHHTVLSTWPPSIGKHHDAASQLQNMDSTGISAVDQSGYVATYKAECCPQEAADDVASKRFKCKLELEVKQHGDASADKAANQVGMGDLRVAMPQRLMMMERDLDSQAQMHALSQSKPSLPAELPRIACPTQPPTAVEGDDSCAQPESREHARQSQAHAHSLQRTVQELSLATQGVRQDAVDLADCLAYLGELREDVATLKNEMQLLQLNVQGSQVPKIFELLHKSDVERQAMRQQIVALHEAMKTAPKHDALCESVQACCMQVAAMQADLSSSQTSVQQVCALEQSMEQLQQYVQTDRASPCKEQTDMACRLKTQLQEMQTSQSAMQTANQQSLAESNRRIMEVQQIAERALDMSSAHPMAQRLELTNKQLTGVSKTTQELLQMHVATVEQLQNLTEKVELGSVQDKVTTIVATLQQHVDNLHNELQQSVDAQQASIQETNMRLKLVVEAQACTQQELLMLRGNLGTVCQELRTKQRIGMRCEMPKVDNLNRVHEDGQMFNQLNMPVISKAAVRAQDSLCLTETATTLVTAGKRLQQCNYEAATVRQAVSDKEDEHTQPSVASNMLENFAAAAERMDGMDFAVETLSIAIVNCQDSIKTLSLQFLGCHQDGTSNSKAESSESQRGLEQQASLTSQTVEQFNTECYSGPADPAGASRSSCKVENMSTELNTDGATTQWKPTQTGSQGLESSGVKPKISKPHADVGQLAERVDSINEAQLAEICEIDVLKGEVDVISSNIQLRADACSEMSTAIEKLQRSAGLQEQRINGIEKSVALLQDTSEARSCDSDCGNRIADLTQQLDLVGERLKNVLDDIDNQQQRAEHHQRNIDAQFAQLSIKVQQSMAEILVLRSSESGTHGGSKAVDPAIFNDEQATQLKQTMKQVSGADEKLSALSEMLVNNRAETAELREVLRALRSGQHQLADDLPKIQIALEERLDMLEERAPLAMDLRQLDAFFEKITNLSTSVDELRANVQNLESTFQSVEADRASSRNLMPSFNESDQEVTQPWQIELETRVGHIEESITLIQRRTQQFTDTQMDDQHLHEKASEDRVYMSNALNKIQVNMDRLQHEVEQMRVIEQQQSELTETVSRLEGHVKVMDSRIEDSAKLNELAVDKSTLDSLLAEVETAMDDIANEMDELKASCQHPVATVIPQVDMLTDQLKKQEQQIKTITHDFDELRVVIGDGSLKEMHLQLEALGQRFRGLADDVEELEVGLRDQKVQMKSSPLTPLPKRIQRLHESTADVPAAGESEVQHCEGCADGQEKLRGEVALPSAQLFARAKGVLTNGEPVVMMQYMCPNAHHMVSIETTESQSAGCSPDRSVDGQWPPPSKADCDSSLSSIGGDLRVMPVHMPGISPSNMQTNDLFVHYTPDEAEVSNTGTMLA